MSKLQLGSSALAATAAAGPRPLAYASVSGSKATVSKDSSKPADAVPRITSTTAVRTLVPVANTSSTTAVKVPRSTANTTSTPATTAPTPTAPAPCSWAQIATTKSTMATSTTASHQKTMGVFRKRMG